MKIYINGKIRDRDEAMISVFDHGLLYGDGVFEGIRIYNGKIFQLREHITRLYQSAHAILLDIPLRAEHIGIKAAEKPLTSYDLYTADECFLTGTGAEIIPVISIDGRTIGCGRPGAYSRRLQEAFKKAVAAAP